MFGNSHLITSLTLLIIFYRVSLDAGQKLKEVVIIKLHY